MPPHGADSDGGRAEPLAAESLSYYAGQSRVTEPGAMSDRLSDLPDNLPALRRVARGLVIHYRADNPSAHGISEERLAEIDSRYAETMLARLGELDDRPLTEARPPKERLVGCCRDFTVLFLTIARSLGIPSRARVGFATYFIPGFHLDHEVAEFFDPGKRRWRLVDAELNDDHADPTDGAPIDPLDVPRDRFLVAGSGWHLCRAGEADPETFLVAPELDIEMTRSWPYLRHNLIHDLAALNKIEMILWDSWGLMEQEHLTPRELELLDRVATATASADPDLSQLRRLYQSEPALRVPATVTSYSPATDVPHEVTLRSESSLPPTKPRQEPSSGHED
jgi:Transglutaminase-like superfamily